MELDLFDGLAEAFGKASTPTDPVKWAWDKAGIELWSKQKEIVYSVRDNKKTASQSAHGTGKSLVAAIIAAWWIDTHPADDTFVISTAPSKDQVSGILWENIRRIWRNAGLDGKVTLDDKWRDPVGELVGQGRKPQDYQQSSFQGIHAKYVLFILDESCGIPKWIWNAAIANTSSDECRVLAIGNPDDPTSEFARVCLKDPTWNVIKISVWDAPNFSGEKVGEAVLEHTVQQSYVDDARAAWGENSALWTSKVEGDFPDTSEDAVIPLTWLLKANERWNMFMDFPTPPDPAVGVRKILGVDVARYGRDKTVIATRVGNVITNIEAFAKKDNVEVAAIIAARMNKSRDKACIDLGGDSGAGVFDILKRKGYKVEAFHPGARTDISDVTKQLKFSRLRSAAWWKLRDALDPAKEPVLAIPKWEDKRDGIDYVSGDLTAPNWEMVLGDRIQVEPKVDIKKKLGRSPDYADAVVLAWWSKPHILANLDDVSFSWGDADHETDDSTFKWGLADDEVEEVY